MAKPKIVLRVCVSPGKTVIPNCRARGSESLLWKLRRLAMAETRAEVTVVDSVCFSKCEEGPNVRITGGAFFHETTEKDLPGIIEAALKAALSAPAKPKPPFIKPRRRR